MNAPSIDIITILEAESGFNPNNFFIGVGSEPPTPINTITLYDTGGYPPMLTFDKEERYEYPSIQIRVRSVDYNTGWQLIEHIKSILHGRANEVWGDNTLYTLIMCSFGPFQLDIDNNQRMRFVINFNIQRRTN